ncbi:MAG: PspC domain-containing protein [Bacteroidia bacterium]|nr:PspC domain-containing protein [Bacteroidia bacterium]
MNKTITINISGIVFYIEEQAYDKLQEYLKKIKSYFENTTGGNDIIEDIELRIAELFTEKISDSKQVLLPKDVDSIIEIMGTPESFAAEDNTTHQEKNNEQDSMQAYQSEKRKRIFRDDDGKVIGGVCSGVAYYFGIDPIWLRLAFAIAFFGFGVGFWVYVILWVIIPKTKTTADKLEMKGEPVNIANIEKNIRKEMEDVKKNMSNLAEDIKTNRPDKPIANFINKLINLFISLFKGLAIVLGKIAGAIAIFIGILLLIVFSSLFFGSDNVVQMMRFDEVESFSFNEIMGLLFTSSSQLNMAKVGLALIIGSIIIWLVFSGVRMFFKLRESRRIVNLIAVSLWLSGLLLCVFVGIKISNQFSSLQRVRTKSIINNLQAKTIYINAVDEDSSSSNKKVLINKGGRTALNIANDLLYFGYPKLDIIKSTTDSFEIEVVRTSRGVSKKDAYSKAKNLNYEYLIKDSAILLDSYFSTPLTDKFRAQELKIILKIPVGKTIYLHDNLEGFMYDVDNITNTYDSDMLGHKWLMTNEGLSCIDC